MPKRLTEITFKAFQARFFFKPSKETNALIVGALARAQAKHKMMICNVVVVSNHFQMLLVPDSEEQLAGFCQHAKSNISKKLGKKIGWTGGLFRSRYSDVPVTDEEAAQIDRMLYITAHGPKESLCPRPQDWPGVNCVRALSTGSMKLEGTWTDEAALYEANRGWERRSRKGEKPKRESFTEPLLLHLSPLPCWAHLKTAELRERFNHLLELVQERFREQIRRVPADWKRRVARYHTGYRPAGTKRSPKPICHAATREARRLFREARSLFVSAYRHASELYRQGNLGALTLFPPGSFPPRLPAIPNTG